MTWRVFAITGGTVAVMGFLGYLLDQVLQTGKVFLMIGIVLAFVVAQILNVMVFSRMTRNPSSSN